MTGTEIAVQDLERDIAPVVARANTIVVSSAEDRADAMEFLKAVKGAQKRATEFFAPVVDSAHKAWKQATAARASVIDPLDAAEKRVKLTVTTWDREEEDRRLAEQRRLQAEEDERKRKERQKIEQEMARQRAIQEEKERQAAEARRKAEEASETDRKRLLAEAEAAERKAAAAAAKVEVKEEQAAGIVASTITLAAPEKQAGEASRKRWKMRLTDKAALIKAAAEGNELAASLLVYDESTGNLLAPRIKGNVTIPGVATYWTTELAVRG